MPPENTPVQPEPARPAQTIEPRPVSVGRPPVDRSFSAPAVRPQPAATGESLEPTPASVEAPVTQPVPLSSLAVSGPGSQGPIPVTPTGNPFAQFLNTGQQPTGPNAPQVRPKIRKPLPMEAKISLAVAGFIVLITGFTFMTQRNKTPETSNSTANITQSVPEQDLQGITLPVEEAQGLQLQGDSEALVVNGDVISRGMLKMYADDYFSNIVQGAITADRSYTLPDANGVVCLDVNNCNYANADDLAALQGQITQQIADTPVLTTGSGLALSGNTLNNVGVLSVNGQTGSLNFTAGGGITIAGTTITNSGVRGIQGSGNVIITDLGNGFYDINDVGAGAATVTIGPATHQTDSSNNATINITKTGTGNLLQLSTGSTPTHRFVVDQTGAITTGSLAFSQLTSVPSIVNTLGGASGTITLGTGLQISSQTLTNTGATSVNGATGAVTLTGGTGINITGTSITNTGVISLTGTTNQVDVSGSSGSVTLSLPQSIAATSNPTFNSLNITTDINGQTIGSTANFNGTVDISLDVTIGGTLEVTTINSVGGLTVGDAVNSLVLQGSDTSISETNGASTTLLTFATPSADVTYLLDTAPAGTYSVCTTTGNCAGVGGGVTTGGGGTNTIAKFTAGQGIGNSTITDDGTTVSIGAILNVATITPTGSLTIGATGQALTLQGNGSTTLTATDSGNTNSLTFATPGSGNHTIIIPNASGTICLTNGNCSGVGGVGDVLQNGNSFGTALTLGTDDNNAFNLETNNTTVASLSSSGAALFKNASNSTTAFQIQNASSQSLFTVDTSTNKVDLLANDSALLGAWSTNSNSMPENRYQTTAVTANGYMYVVGGYTGSSQLNSVIYAKVNGDGSVGAWATTSALPATRADASAVVANGYLYAVGGRDTITNTGTNTVLYARLNIDGTVGTWQSSVNTLPDIRTGVATAVANGYMYVIGGNSNGGPGPYSTVYYAKLNPDGSTGTWGTANTLPATASQPEAVVINGYLYVFNGSAIYSARLNISGTIGSWTTLTSLPGGSRSRYDVQVAQGYVYAIGGTEGGGPNSMSATYQYARPTANGGMGTWTSVSSTVNRQAAGGAVLNGYIYIFGGSNVTNNGNVVSTVNYASLPRVRIGGSLDLVGVVNGNLSEGGGGLGGSLVAGDGDFLGRLSVRDQALFASSVAVGKSLTVSGDLNVSSASGSLLNVDSTNATISLMTGSPDIGAWRTNANSLPQGVNDGASVAGNGYVYMIGGHNGSSYLNTVYYAKLNADGSTGAWQTNANALPAVRQVLKAEIANGYIYAIAGWNGSASLDTIVYAKLNADGSTGAWQTNTTVLPAIRQSHGTDVYNGYMYVVGGSTSGGGAAQSTVYYAKLNTDGSIGTWTSTSSLPGGARQPNTTIVNGYIYSVGGDSTSVVYYARLNTNGTVGTWSATTSLPGNRSDAGVIGMNGYIYVVGGNEGTTRYTTVYYARVNSDGTLGSWTTSAVSTPVGLSGLESVAVNGYIYLMGGHTGGTAQSAVYYTNTARTLIGGSLDLVGATTGNLADGVGNAGSLYAGNGDFLGRLSVRDQAIFGSSITVERGASISGDLTVRSSIGSMLSADSTSMRVQANSATGGEVAPWQTNASSLPAVRAAHASTTYNGYMYVIGGSSANLQSSNGQSTVYYAKANADGSTGAWATNANALPAARSWLAAVAASGYMYVLGGDNTSGASQSTVYVAKINGDGSTGTWSATTSMPNARSQLSAVASNGYVYIMGGYTTCCTELTTVYYSKINNDGTLGSWIATSSLPAGRRSHGSVVVNGYVYVLGGSGASTVYYAKINNDGSLASWATNANALPTTHLAAGYTTSNGYIYLVSGQHPGLDVTTSTRYAKVNSDGSTGTWQTAVNTLSTGRSYLTAVAINGYVYALGGCRTTYCSTSSVVEYAAVARLQVGGTLDLVSLNGAGGGDLIAGGILASGPATFQGGVSVIPTLDSPSVFQVHNAAGQSLLNVDSANFAISLNGSNSGELTAWRTNANAMPTARYGLKAVIADGYIYYIGGQGTNQVYYAKLNADGSTGAWVAGTSLPANRSNHAALVANGFLYAVGGGATVYYAKLNTDGSTGSWQTSTLPTARSSHASVVANGYMYMIGGSQGGTTDTVMYAKLNTDGSIGAWMTESDTLPAARENVSAAVFNGYVYVVGGYNSGSQTTVYYAKLNADGSTGAWQTNANSLPTTRYSHGVIAMNGYIYAISGAGPGGSENTTVYARLNADGSVGAWSTSASLIPVGANFAGYAAANGYIYIIGGYNSSLGGNQSGVYYTSIGRIKVGGTLDLVGVNNGNLADGGSANGGSIIAGDGDFLGKLSVREQATFANSITVTNGASITGDLVVRNNGDISNWQTTTVLPAIKGDHRSVTVNGYVYVIGGFNASTVYYAKLNSNGTVGSWTTSGNSLPADRWWYGIASSNNYIYVVGGTTSGANTVYYTKVSADGSIAAWQTTTVLPSSKSALTAVVANGFLYAIGGGTDVYYARINPDGTVGSWSSATSLPVSVSRHSSVTANGYVYVIGGSSSSTVYTAKLNLDGTLGSWASTTSLPATRSLASAVVLNGNIYLIGGDETTTTYYAAINSDGTVGSWSTSSVALPDSRSYHSSVVANGYIYAIGGGNGPNYYNTVYYTSTARLKIGGSLDLVGASLGGNLAEGGGGLGGSITAGNGDFLGSLNVRDQATFLSGAVIDKDLTVNGSTLFRTATNSVTGFQVQNASGSAMFVIDTTNGNFGFRSTDYGSGTGVIAIANATAVPSTNPSGGGVLYSESGRLKWRRSDGLVDVLGSVREITLTAGDFLGGVTGQAAPGTGDASASGTGSGWTAALQFDHSSPGTGTAWASIPDDWTTFHVDLVWSNTNAGTGDVVWNCTLWGADDGEAFGSGNVSCSNQTITAATQGTTKISRIGNGLSASAVAGKPTLIYINRLASDVADSLTGNASLIAVVLRKAN